jgi:hypothetical protein
MRQPLGIWGANNPVQAVNRRQQQLVDTREVLAERRRRDVVQQPIGMGRGDLQRRQQAFSPPAPVLAVIRSHKQARQPSSQAAQANLN